MDLMSKEEIIENSGKVEIPGIYFLIENQEIVYIGMSRNLIPRLADHIYDKSFDQIYWKEIVDSNRRTRLEREYIKKYEPKLNKDYTKSKPKKEGKSQFWDIQKVSQELEVSVRTLRRYIERGELTAYKIGNKIKVKPEDLRDFIESREMR